MVTEKLEEVGALLKMEFITHSYPHDWRTKKPVIFRATAQWFASIDAFRDDLLAAVKGVNWTPAWGETRLFNMVRDRGDWVISRQRAWAFHYRFSMRKMGKRLSQTKQLITFLNFSVSMVRMFGLNAM